MRQIIITEKSTSANTTYYSISDTDRDHIFSNLERYLAEFTECAADNPEFRDFFLEPNPDMTRYEKSGVWHQNSMARQMAGLLKNYHNHHGRNDISKPQIRPIEDIFRVINVFTDGQVQAIRFRTRQELINAKDQQFRKLFGK